MSGQAKPGQTVREAARAICRAHPNDKPWSISQVCVCDRVTAAITNAVEAERERLHADNAFNRGFQEGYDSQRERIVALEADNRRLAEAAHGVIESCRDWVTNNYTLSPTVASVDALREALAAHNDDVAQEPR